MGVEVDLENCKKLAIMQFYRDIMEKLSIENRKKELPEEFCLVFFGELEKVLMRKYPYLWQIKMEIYKAEYEKKCAKENMKKKRSPLDSRLRHEVFKRDGYKCKECGIGNREGILHVDHIIPVSQGGTDELDNLQTLCDKCNLAKSGKAWVSGQKTSALNL